MKKFYALSLALSTLVSVNAFSQNFSFTPTDTVQGGSPGDEVITYSRIINNSGSAIAMHVVRVKNVIVDQATWTSAFCLDVCYLPTTDSVGYTFQNADTVDFSFHCYTDAGAPGTATGRMKFKNVATPSNTFIQTYYCGTTAGFGINDLNKNLALVSIYPMPVASNEPFMMSISNVQTKKPVSLVVYDLLGNKVRTQGVIEGVNILSLDLSAGIYAYSLLSENLVIQAGKIAVSK